MTRTVIVNDRMQKGYVYDRTEPMGPQLRARIHAAAHAEATARIGVFGGKYMTDCRDEFPARWFARARLCAEFGVNASQSLAQWRRKGWIHAQDPRGWFQWYCRYYMGRRTSHDARQIRRWRAIARHVAAIRKPCEKGDIDCRRRQAVLHWAYDSRAI